MKKDAKKQKKFRENNNNLNYCPAYIKNSFKHMIRKKKVNDEHVETMVVVARGSDDDGDSCREHV